MATAGGVLAWGARGRSSTLFGPSVCRGNRSRRSIALTFDDGPTRGSLELLRVLDDFGVRATFFECGVQVERSPEVAREVAARGHEIGNHTHTHPRLYLRSGRFIADELTRAQEAIEKTTGRTPGLFRAPYGVRWAGLRAAQRKLGLLGVMWTAIGGDWRLAAPEVAKRIVSGAGPGAIICLHDGRELTPDPDISNTIDAVRKAIPVLLDRGFRFETVSDILCPTT
ncbi:MAG TPA: polysaccharide deacetylase family protein [Bryobacteraceae bacterium]|nr:polysaccharide deacetylase family protein [Bryobacteraceae bacterium]